MPDLFNMLDIETMSTEPDAAIITIASAHFNPRVINTDEELRALPSFSMTIDLEDNERCGRHISAGTVKWWLSQSKGAQDDLLNSHQHKLSQVLQKFGLWVTNHPQKPTQAFANGPEFDHVILQNACKQLGVMWPFRYWQSQSLRTVQLMAWPDGDMPDITFGTAHNALDDVYKQIRVVQYAYAKLGC